MMNRRRKWWLIIPLALVCVVLVAMLAIWAIFGLGNPTVKEGSAPSTTHLQLGLPSQLGNGAKPIPDDPCELLRNRASAIVKELGRQSTPPSKTMAGLGNMCDLKGAHGSATLIISSAPTLGSESWFGKPDCTMVVLPREMQGCIINHAMERKGLGAGVVLKSPHRGVIISIDGASIPSSDLRAAAAAIAQELK